MNIGTQSYPWSLWCQKEKREFDLDEVLAEVKACGFDAWEQTISSENDANRLRELLPKHGLQLHSIYDNLRLHEDGAQEIIERAVGNAQMAKELGASVFVVNPEPINWSNPIDKNDAQLRFQAHSMQTLGEKLGEIGIALALHIHAPEMRQAAREFHHMLLATSPDAVGLCLDTHWIFRGAGDSQIALFDAMQLYASRIKSLHLRQSQSGIWSESFSDGDIDNREVVRRLKEVGFSGPIILEQAFENGTPDSIGFLAAQKNGLDYARETFGAL